MDLREKLEVIAHLGDHITYKEDIGICYDSALAKVIEDAYMELKNGVTMQEWIPVSEPPILPGDYLCYFEFEPESPNVICEDTYNEGGRWMTEKEKITHWMPLPLPPGKGE